MKKIIAFDQDDTLNITKQPLDAEMAELMIELLRKYKVFVVSGTNWELLSKFDIDTLPNATSEELDNLFIMPTIGTQLWRHVGDNYAEELTKDQIIENGWLREYAHFLTDEQVAKISESLERAAKKLGFWPENPTGEVIENRQSQVTYSALGQFAKSEDKYAWDPDRKKREQIVELIEPELSDIGVEIGIGGSTSVDITTPGIDKAYAMRQIIKHANVAKEEILFIGDKLQPGGNDYPVREFGVDTIEVRSCEDTKWVIRGILGVTQ